MLRNPPKIAIVDDDQSVLTALGRLIAAAGYEVETFISGAAFLESAENHEPDCVVLDLHMPNMSGLEVQSLLKSGHAGIPVLFLTGGDSPEARSCALGGGASAYLCKPVDQDTLLAAINVAVTSGPQ
jgi:FixJ family two-component response regulator